MVGGLKPGDPPLIGPYRLVGQLGSGGMGRVFLGLSAGGRPVAVKVIRAELAADQEFRVRFGREVAAARRVSGLFTALVVDADVDGPVPWLATAYVAGPSLSEAVASQGPMSVQSALALAAGLAEGLSAIHAAGVVHCDLKPSNVLLSQDGPRVIDFGISRAAEVVSATGAGQVAGSPGFMSPEQATGAEIGPPSDIFSLGAVLTFAATGEGPFGKGSRPELAYHLVYSAPSLGGLPAALGPLVERCLAKDPRKRPTAEEVLAEAGAVRPAVGWSLGAFAQYTAPRSAATAAPRSAATAAPPPPRRWSQPMTAAGVTMAVVATSVLVSLAPGRAVRPSAQFAPRVTATRPSGPAAPRRAPDSPAPASPAPASRGPEPVPNTIPAVVAVTSPPASVGHAPSATATRTRPASASPSPTASPTPSPSASTPDLPPVPQITRGGTYRQGVWVNFEVYYAAQPAVRHRQAARSRNRGVGLRYGGGPQPARSDPVRLLTNGTAVTLKEACGPASRSGLTSHQPATPPPGAARAARP